MQLSQKQGHLLLSIAVAPEAPMEYHKKIADVDKLGNSDYELREHSLVVKNPVSGVAKRKGEYFKYQPEPSEEFADKSEESKLKEKIIEALKFLDGNSDSIKKLSNQVPADYQKVLTILNSLQNEEAVKIARSGNKKGVELLNENISLNEPEYDTWMITGKGVQALKEFIEEQPPILQSHLVQLYEKKIVYAPKHCGDKIEA